MHWYCRCGDRQLGPLTASQLRSLAERGEIDDRWEVRRDVDEAWQPVATILYGVPPAANGNVGGNKASTVRPSSDDRVGGSESADPLSFDWDAAQSGEPSPALPTPDEPAPYSHAASTSSSELSVDLFAEMPEPPAVEPSKRPPPLPRRAGPPPLPKRSDPVSVSGPGFGPSPDAFVVRPVAVTIFSIAAMIIGVAALFVPLLETNHGLQAEIAARGIAWWVFAGGGVLSGLCAMVAGAGLFAGGEWARRVSIGLFAVLPFYFLAMLPIGWFVGAMAVTAVVVTALSRQQVVDFCAAAGPISDAEEGREALDVRVVAGLYGVLLVTALVLRIAYAPTLPEPPIAIRDSENESPVPNASPATSSIARLIQADPSLPANLSRASGSSLTPLESDDRLYRETAPDDGWLVGIEIVEGRVSERVSSLRPIFGGPTQETIGPVSGEWAGNVKSLKAKPGYAVGGMKASSGKVSEGFCLTFMRIVGDRLDPGDSYDGEWIGEQTGPVETLGGEGRMVQGLFGRVSPDGRLLGMGLVFQGDPAPRAPDGEKRWQDSPHKDHPIFGWGAETASVGKQETRIVGGDARDAGYAFQSAGEGHLVGFEFGLDDRFGREVITAIRPIVRLRGESLYGPWYGEKRRRVVVVRGDGDDVVTAVRVYGRERADGVRVTFSGAGRDGVPYTNRSYESEPVGYLDEGRSVSLSGYGRKLVGLTGRTRDGRNTGLGVVLGPMIRNRLIAWNGARPMVEHDASPLGTHAEGFLDKFDKSRWFGSDAEFEVRKASTALLVGMEYVVETVDGVEVIVSLRPLYVGKPAGSSLWHGERLGKRVEVRAKEGFAVSGARIYGSLRVEGMQLTFSRIGGRADSYDGPLVGRADERRFAHFSSRGRAIGDVRVRKNEDYVAGIQFSLGDFSAAVLASLDANVRGGRVSATVPPRGSASATASRPASVRLPSPMVGGGPPAAPPAPGPFVESVPPGAMLVALEVGLKKESDGELRVASLRAIYGNGTREVPGTLRGAARVDEVRTIRARPDHGAVAMVANGWSQVRGIQLRFAPRSQGQPDWKAAYNSEWVGQGAFSTRSFPVANGKFLEGFAGIATDEGIWQLDSHSSALAEHIAAFQKFASGRPPFGAPRGPQGRMGPTDPRSVLDQGLAYGPRPVFGPGMNYGPGTMDYSGSGIGTSAGARFGARSMPPSLVPPRFPKFDRTTSFREPVPAGSWLVGFEATLSSSEPDAVVTSVRPIFRKGGVETRGASHGTAGPQRIEVKAPDGYAVAALAAPGGVTRDGFQMTAMKIVEEHLSPRQLARLPAIGGMRTTEAESIGVGSPVQAVFGRTSEKGEFIGLGLEFAPIETVAPDPWKENLEVVSHDPKSPATNVTGGYGSGAGAGRIEGPVTGVEFGLVEWFGRDVIGAVHAVGAKYKFGKVPNDEWNWDRKIRIDARPGYALSAMRIYGERNADGVRLIFSRFKNGKLDLTDSYESEPVGDVREDRVVLLSGRGRTVQGLYVTRHLGRVKGFRLELEEQGEGTSPPPDRLPPAKKQLAGEVEAAHGAAAETAPEGTSITRMAGIVESGQRWSTQGGGRGPVLGLEVGLAKRGGKEFVCGLRWITPPLFGGLRERTDWRGSPGTRQVRVEAEPGYAVGAVRVFGKDGIDGLQVTFCRIDGDRLDIEDGYNAEPVGTVDPEHYVQLTGKGRQISSLNLAGNLEGVTALGLHFAEEKKPAVK